jgi:hypothetical protein
VRTGVVFSVSLALETVTSLRRRTLSLLTASGSTRGFPDRGRGRPVGGVAAAAPPAGDVTGAESAWPAQPWGFAMAR